MEYPSPETLSHVAAMLQFLIAMVFVGVGHDMRKEVDDHHFLRFIMISIVIGSVWSAMAILTDHESLYGGIIYFLASILFFGVWIIWFREYHIRKPRKGTYMKRHEFFRAHLLADKFFGVQEDVMIDGDLTEDDLEVLCANAQAYIRQVFPMYADHITVEPSPHGDAFGDFAGYEITYDDGTTIHREAFEFDYGSQGIDVK